MARALRLGADMVGQAACNLAPARQSAEAVADHLALRQAALLPG